MNIVLIISFVIGYVKIAFSAPQCIWNINEDLPFKDPVFYQLRGKGTPRLLVPDSGKGISLEQDHVLNAFCPGSGNYLQDLGRDEVELSCINGTSILVEGMEKTVADLECVKTVSGEVKHTEKTCSGTKGHILSIGYDSPSGWLQLFDVCYDFSSAIALYAHHTLYGTAMAGAFVGNDRPAFKTSGLPSNVSIISAYKKTTQQALFTKLLGESQADIYMSNNTFLSKGHLAADADFISHSWQRSTYFYANAIPQWMNINGGNWLKVEKSVRDAAKNKNEILKVWTGSAGVLELKDENNNNVRMFLAKKNSIPIPMYIWKVVCDLAKSCISFVVYNNPVEGNGTICNNICRDTKWYKNGFEKVSKGYINCCEVKDLNDTLQVLPDIQVSSILKF